MVHDIRYLSNSGSRRITVQKPELLNDHCYKVDVYNIYLFKRTINRRVYSFSIPSIAFLGEHDFDFNKAINKGVTYANLDEISMIRSDLEEGLLDYDIFGERFNSHLISVQCHLSDMLERLRKAASPPTISVYQIREIGVFLKEITFAPFVVNLDDAIFDPYACRSEAQPLNHRKTVNEIAGASQILYAIIDARLVCILSAEVFFRI
uniref:Uncharacterized protein n=1 Tax=Parascaris equorum TaxID=6256 RepID=A0A914RNU9_PAREQ